ncbi:ribonuclease H1 [Plutella xylostella]|uniref:ribonuclease H1 n=1 Tax=Plutella xylostella TaxID=51655 RepID=UPI0020329119|nr:ribonuclease H1 [Plutella xylostella]
MSFFAGVTKVLNLITLLNFNSNIRGAIYSARAKMPFYAVAKGRTPGIFMSWGDCEAQVKGFSGARYKKFDSIDSAQEFITKESGGSIGGAKAPAKNSRSSFTKPSTANTNLKRPYSTGANNNSTGSKKVTASKPRNKQQESDEDSDTSDDLNSIICKQMDDIEKRLQNSAKTIDKIYGTKSKPSNRKAILIEQPQPKRRRSSNLDFKKDADGYVQVYTDGACSANGRSGARAGLGVYWGDGHELNASEPVSGRATNNCGEIQAATWAIKQALQNGIKQLAINTDSQFVINAVTKWMPGWKKKGWKLASGEPVKNEKDFKELDSVQSKIAVKWVYVEAHKGIHGNEMADQLAKDGASRYNQ